MDVTQTGTARRVAGCDLGKATAKFVVLRVDGNEVEIERTDAVEHEGRPIEAFQQWYEEAGIPDCAALGATGVHADRLVAPVLSELPEDACLAAALPHLAGPEGAVSIVSIGARGYGVLTRNSAGHVQFVENDKCSSGTGETMVRIAGRFDMDIAQADKAASGSEESIPITARCSVFAKSEMTHFGNQGKAAPALFRGYFGSVAKYVNALLARARVDGPVLVVGGCARITTLTDALSEACGTQVTVPDLALHAEALGAALLAADQTRSQSLASLPGDPESLVRQSRTRFTTLAPASEWRGRVTRQSEQPVPHGTAAEPSVLGIDLGSTGSKAVLTNLATGDAVLDLYDRTRGNPVDALQRLLRALLAETTPDVRAIALTGSGREAAASVLRAAYPDANDRIITLNEIVAHATAAIRCDPDDGESLSIVEIGGQDAKFIQILGGKIVESDMNKACSAGTGSFLEEQALFYGIEDIAEFGQLASESTRPPDLGQMCTVFVAEAAAEAHNEGYEKADLFGGFQYSVIHNYINRVMGQRTFGQRIFFQGKPATDESLAWTLAAVTGREVVVPANPGAMGAWGIGLCAIEELDQTEGAAGGSPGALSGALAFDLEVTLAAEVVAREEFQCKDQRCATLCSIERTRVSVAGSPQTVLSGGACPRYEVGSSAKTKLPIEAPSAFDEREALIDEIVQSLKARADEGRPVIGIPEVGSSSGFLPWLTTFASELGFHPVLLRPDKTSLSRGEECCYSYDACAPAKVAHGVLDADVEHIFFPKIISISDRDGSTGKTCAMEQAKPDIVREALTARGRQIEIVSPPLAFEAGLRSDALTHQLADAAALLEPGPASPAELKDAETRASERLERVALAQERAAAAQELYEARLAEIGTRTLEWGRSHGVPVVPVCGPLHVIHDPVVNAGVPRLLRENGVLALPMECYPIPAETPPMTRIAWGDANRAMRVAAAARLRGDAYPLLLSSFGCGPNSFVEQLFAGLLEGHPHTTLESDGHGGMAGYTTRVQAFLHTVRRHNGEPSAATDHRLALFEELPNPPIRELADKRFVVFSISDRFSPMMAATYRAHGIDAIAAGPADSEALKLGRRDCSGKECLPYQLIWGSFRKVIEHGTTPSGSEGVGAVNVTIKTTNGDTPASKDDVFVQVTGEGACRNCMFSIKDQLTIERLGLDDRVTLRDLQMEMGLGITFPQRIASSLAAWDILFQLAAYHRTLEESPGEVDELYSRFCDELERLTERPVRRGGRVRTIAAMARNYRQVRSLVGRASKAFAKIGERAKGRDDLRTVLLSGDIYLRVDEFASDWLIRRLNDRGLLVAVEPAQTFMEYLAGTPLHELVRFPEGQQAQQGLEKGIRQIRQRLYKRVTELHPWMPTGATAPIIAESRPIIGDYPIGEAPVTIGSVLHHWNHHYCDGVVVVSPWGCGPALVSESILRHRRHIPTLFVYSDGSPIDERRLNAFAFRLQGEEPRTGTPSGASVGASAR